MHKILLFLLGITITSKSVAQLAYPYKVYSENQNYFVKSVPFSDQVWTEQGRTTIYKGDTLHPISIFERYFSPDYLFLSNDGKSMFYLDNWIGDASNESIILMHYYSGELKHQYKLPDLKLSDTVSIHSVLYNSYNEKDSTVKYPQIDRSNNFFIKGDTLFLFVQDGMVNKLSMTSGQLIERESFDNYMKVNSHWQTNRRIDRFDIKIPTQFGLPKMADGQEFWKGLEKKLDVVFNEGQARDPERKYKQYMIKIACTIDSTGICKKLYLDMYDSIYKTEISEFLLNVKYDKLEIPFGIEQWNFHYITGFRKKSKWVAVKERKREIELEKLAYQRRILQDSIDNIYIPLDIQESFIQLDKILTDKQRNEFKSKSEDIIVGQYHFGLGLWIRNNWCLWAGSRLSEYFKNFGVSHPDTMSSIILTSYHRYLNNKDIKLEEQINGFKD